MQQPFFTSRQEDMQLNHTLSSQSTTIFFMYTGSITGIIRTLTPPDTIVTAVVVRIKAFIAGSFESNLQSHTSSRTLEVKTQTHVIIHYTKATLLTIITKTT